MTNKTVFVATFVVLNLLALSPALALDPSVTPRRRPWWDLRRDIKDARQDFREEKKDARSNFWRRRAPNKAKVEALYQTMRNRFTKRYDFLINKAKAKIQSRIDAKKAQGKDVTTAQNKLNEVGQYQTAYTTDLAAFDAKYNELISSETPKDVFPALKEAGKKIADDLKNIRRVEIEAIKILVKI